MFRKRVLPALLLLGLPSCAQTPSQLELNGLTMGTTYSVKVVLPGGSTLASAELQPGIESILQRINSEMSTYDPESEITRFNHHDSADPFAISPGFLFVVERSLAWSQKTGGAFDVTVFPLLEIWGFGPKDAHPPKVPALPAEQALQHAMRTVGYTRLSILDGKLVKSDPELKIDLGGIAKGYGVDAVFDYLAGRRLGDFMVEIGGEIRAKGKNLKGSLWRVGIAKPVPSPAAQENPDWILALQDQAVATSGDYQSYIELDGRTYSHEIDPRTGHPAATGIASATVTAPNCTDADALATALMILEPEEGLRIIESLPDTEALLVIRDSDRSYRVLKTSQLTLEKQAPEEP